MTNTIVTLLIGFIVLIVSFLFFARFFKWYDERQLNKCRREYEEQQRTAEPEPISDIGGAEPVAPVEPIVEESGGIKLDIVDGDGVHKSRNRKHKNSNKQTS